MCIALFYLTVLLCFTLMVFCLYVCNPVHHLYCTDECVRVKFLAMRDLYWKCVYSPKNRENSGHLANGTNLISDHLLADCRGATCHKRGGTEENKNRE